MGGRAGDRVVASGHAAGLGLPIPGSAQTGKGPVFRATFQVATTQGAVVSLPSGL